jgi:isopenicillin N synthase-like dioxygenase
MPTNNAPEFAVPVIDIGAYTRPGNPVARAEVARRMDEACSTVGFVQITGHGIADDVVAGLARAIDGFFALTAEQKMAYRGPAVANRGYSPPRSEALSLSAGAAPAARMNDFFEAFNVGSPASDHPGVDLSAEHYAENLWPGEVAGFRSDVGRYYAEAGRVARTLTSIFADALGMPAGFFTGYTDHSIDVLRMNNYALDPGEVTLDGELTGMGQHTDFGIVTVLWADDVPGLQVLGSDHLWHDISPAPGALLVNLGDLMARWTNDRWMSTLHRVKPPVVDGRVLRRRSAAFFHDGNSDAVISTVSSCAAEGPGYAPITVAEHITAKLSGSRGGVLNLAAEREAARIMAAEALA